MLKILLRLALLLAVCLLIAGGVYALVQANAGSLAASAPGFEGHDFAGGEGPRARPADADLAAGPGSGSRFPDGDHDRGGSAAGWLGLLKNVGLIAAMTLVVAGLRRLIAPLFRRPRDGSPVSAAGPQ